MSNNSDILIEVPPKTISLDALVPKCSLSDHLQLNATSLVALREQVTARNKDHCNTVLEYFGALNQPRDEPVPQVNIYTSDLVRSIDDLIVSWCREIDDLVFSEPEQANDSRPQAHGRKYPLLNALKSVPNALCAREKPKEDDVKLDEEDIDMLRAMGVDVEQASAQRAANYRRSRNQLSKPVEASRELERELFGDSDIDFDGID